MALPGCGSPSLRVIAGVVAAGLGLWSPAGALAAKPALPAPPTTPPAIQAPEVGATADEPFHELPLLTWEQENELRSTVRQVLFNAYLPLLARPTRYRGVHNDPIPDQMNDWDYQRPEVRAQLLGRQRSVDATTRARGGLGDAETNALIARKIDFRPEDLEALLLRAPRIDDLVVDVRRVQPLGLDVYRVDFDVRLARGGAWSTTTFADVDVYRGRDGSWLLPMRVLLELPGLAGLELAGLDVGGLAGGRVGTVIALPGQLFRVVAGAVSALLP